MKLLVLASTLVLAVATVSGEPPVRFHQFRRGSASFGRLQQAPHPGSFARQVAEPPQGYDYPKPASSGYAYPKPEQPFPLPEEPAPTTTTVAPVTTTELPTTTAVPVDDYEDVNATEDPEAETVEAEAVAGRLRAARLRQARRRNGLAARLEQQLQDDDDNQQQQQQPQQPIYLVNIPESTLQRLVLLNEAAAAAYPAQLKLAPVPAAAAAPLQVAAPAPIQTPQVYITDYGLVYAKK